MTLALSHHVEDAVGVHPHGWPPSPPPQAAEPAPLTAPPGGWQRHRRALRAPEPLGGRPTDRRKAASIDGGALTPAAGISRKPAVRMRAVCLAHGGTSGDSHMNLTNWPSGHCLPQVSSFLMFRISQLTNVGQILTFIRMTDSSWIR